MITRLGRKGQLGKDGEKRTARKENKLELGKNSEVRTARKGPISIYGDRIARTAASEDSEQDLPRLAR